MNLPASPDPFPPDPLTPAEAAALCGVSRKTIARRIHAGHLRVWRDRDGLARLVDRVLAEDLPAALRQSIDRALAAGGTLPEIARLARARGTPLVAAAVEAYALARLREMMTARAREE